MLLVLFAVLAGSRAHAQLANQNYAVQLSAVVNAAEPSITFTCPEDNTVVWNGYRPTYTVWRRPVGATSWGSPIASGSAITVIPGNPDNETNRGHRQFIDRPQTGLVVGQAYEYKFHRVFNNNGAYQEGFGYIQAGINVPLTAHRGTIILLVDAVVGASLSTEIARLKNDLVGDGWRVVYNPNNHVPRGEAAPTIKANRIKAVYDTVPNVKAVFLLGRITVPYSGLFPSFPPDGHNDPSDDHRGAWPADVYYGDMDGVWSDTATQVNNTHTRNSNLPGDGKFDTSYLNSQVELQVGRVDFHEMGNEVELLRAYLNRDHAYRQRQMAVQSKALVAASNDSAGGQATPASGFRNFAPLVGTTNIDLANSELSAPVPNRWISMVKAPTVPYLWSFGAGAGSNNGVSHLGLRAPYNSIESQDLITPGDQADAVFFLFFGSWFADWDRGDNLLRTCLMVNTGLASAWSGRPHLVFHSMGLGETLGYSIRASQNNDGSETSGYQNQVNQHLRGVHIALLGDPTLRLYPVPPVRNINASGSTLQWLSPQLESGESLVELRVFRRNTSTEIYDHVATLAANATSYPAPSAGDYMVRAIKLQTTPSGTFYNASQGALVTVSGSDTTSPTVQSPAIASSTTASVTYTVTFSEPVTGVDGSDFQVVTSGGATGTVGSVSPTSSSVYTAVVNFTGTSGTVRLDVKSTGTGIVDGASNPLTTGATGQTHTINSGGGGQDVNWFHGSLPAGSWGGAGYGGDPASWDWTTGPQHEGAASHRSPLQPASVKHGHGLNGANPWAISAGEKLFTYIYLDADPAKRPTSILLSWSANNGTGWEHRAYWGNNVWPYGTNGTASRRSMGAIPSQSGWVRLEVAASDVGLEGTSIVGMDFGVEAGDVSWGRTGRKTAGGGTPPPSDTVWFSGSLPPGAWAGAGYGGDPSAWDWTTGPQHEGAASHRSPLQPAGTKHGHGLNDATPWAIGTGEKLFAYIYLDADPAKRPTSILLSWRANDSSGWEHRAYWGANVWPYGTNNTNSRRSMGAIPAGSGWVRLEVPASSVGLETLSIIGMDFGVEAGDVAWGRTGKSQ